MLGVPTNLLVSQAKPVFVLEIFLLRRKTFVCVHEVRYNDGDNHEVVLVDRDVSLEVLVRKGDRRETSLKECGEKINVNVPDGV